LFVHFCSQQVRQVTMIRWKWIFCLLLLLSMSYAFFVDDSIHHLIEYRLSEVSSNLLELDDDNNVVIRTRDYEQYTCSLPLINEELTHDFNYYNGPTPWELISPLKEGDVCSQRNDPFWSYEICHGKYVRQFHSSKDQKLSFYLGNFHANFISLTNKLSNDDKIKVNGEELPYLPVLYSQGTTCDLTGQPRRTRVMYVCYATPHEVIESITEVSTCNYDVVVLTQLICSHPLFKGITSPTNKIICTSHNKQSDPTPKSYTPVAHAQANNFHASYAPTVDRILKRSFAAIKEYDMKSDKLTELYTEMEKMKEKRVVMANSIDPIGLNDVLSGVACLDSGGQEYWNYKFCHMKTVLQYHDNGGTIQNSIGEFNIDEHIQYLMDNPSKRPNRYGGKVVQVVHFYSGGARCDDTSSGAFPRSTEVRIRCPIRRERQEKEELIFKISEPSKCKYIMTIESEQLCTAIQRTDHDGIFN
ncbi:hypothetical protein PFISCL1PPCAC_20014, partial [Pristionchus fissidentatus]